MRIAIDYTSAIAQSAGIGRYTRGLVAALAGEVTTDQLVLYSSEAPRDGLAPLAGRARLRTAGLGRRALGNRTMTILWHRLGVPLPIEAFTGPVAVFHAPDFSLAPTLAARRVVTIHDLAYLLRPECALPSLIAYLSVVVPRAVARADRVIAVSARTAADLTARLGIPPERIAVIPLGIEPRFAPVRDTTRLTQVAARYGLRRPLVLAVGTLEPRKNYPRLIAAVARAARAPDGPRMLAIAGRAGWLYDDIYAAAARSGLGDAVRFLGYVPDADLPALYALADVVAVPSLYEGFGIPALEAMACGVPVVCADAGALPEVAGDAALLVAPEDEEALAAAIMRALTDQPLRAALVARGLTHARAFTWERAARAHLAIYHEVASHARRRGGAR